jgi:hypothetical protein
MAASLVIGRIVWADIPDANGARKLRPAVIVAVPDSPTPEEPFFVVAVTSRLPAPLPDDHVLLPWHREGHPRTGLNRRCAAVCTWVAQIIASDIQDTAGVVPATQMASILSKVASALPGPGAPPDANDAPDAPPDGSKPEPPSTDGT